MSTVVAATALASEPPTVTAVSANEGAKAGGTSVTITGTSFLGVTAVTFGWTTA